MTQPPGPHPPEGSFGAAYDPPPGAPQPAPPGYGYPPQQPGPYAPQAGPYGTGGRQPDPYARPNPYAQHPGHGFPPQPPTVTAPQGGPPPGPGGGGRFRGRTGVVVGAVLAVLLLAGGGIWLATGDDGGGTGKPVAGKSDDPAKPSGSPGPDKDTSVTGPTAAELNAGRKPGEAKVAWLAENGVDLPAYGEDAYGPWFAGDIVAKGMYRKVTGYAAADGTEKWSLPLPTDLCAAPTLPTEDGKIVVAVEDNVSEDEADCSVLQMIDLRTGKAGWKKTVPRTGLRDALSHVAMSVNGGTVTFGRTGITSAFRIADGKELFGRREGVCQPYAYTSGARMIGAVSCQAEPADPVQDEVQEVDPATGAPKWTYRLKPGWQVDHVYSVSPPVISIKQEGKWAIAVLNDDGTYRSQLAGGDENYAVRCDEDSVAEGGNLDGCAGVTADSSRVYLSTEPRTDSDKEWDTNKIVAFDLATGKSVWKAAAPAHQLVWPLRMEGTDVLVHVEASSRTAGSIATLAPTGGELRTLLKHPASAAGTESSLFTPEVAYEGGRSVLMASRISADDDEEEMAATALLVFGE
ncbi:PQQ-binding-like beta-propeller repeat protein [Streptomyces sp. NPDC056844]|uniref:outer membrane protein assembly factor BamB family protein n=1 Tax=unclassified Streptomyces TaxID=2593676 RepID=UPI003689482D